MENLLACLASTAVSAATSYGVRKTLSNKNYSYDKVAVYASIIFGTIGGYTCAYLINPELITGCDRYFAQFVITTASVIGCIQASQDLANPVPIPAHHLNKY